ncbi:uncharacterized protein [Parasteatoda tepidariorum]|uniref:uncharacterized protein n=1 Tax=Parasteatoda tepidariorum TaxID=114398 RepID=UPI001C723F2F|nr:uncharacterized protein LOC107456199 [Parasteatoda tepidariorum]XP_042905679.1 uncharacterized protein LOC107456199 [Parasteatoda tepidariorum]
MFANILVRRPRTYAFIICVAFLIFYIWFANRDGRDWNDNYIMKLVNTRLSLIISKTERPIIVKGKNPGLILDTPGCKIPKLDPFDPSVIDLYEKTEVYDCAGRPLFMHSQPGGSIALNKTALKVHYDVNPKDVFCVYRGIYRLHEKAGDVRENSYSYTEYDILDFDVPLKQDHIVVNCDIGGKENFTQFFPLVYLKKEVESVKSKIPEPPSRLNVIIHAIDSISKLNFLRHFKKTKRFIKEKGNFFDMKGYNKVGDNTFPNLTPLLTGQHVEAIWNESVKNSMFFDDVDIIWKKYSEKGFRTFYAEDSPFFGTFNYARRGFNNTPTDYYMRPLYLAMHKSELRKKKYWYCFNNQLEPEIMYNYVADFIATMGTRPYFTFSITSSLTHDYINHAGYADAPATDFLEKIWTMGALNNSVVILFGDHGLRFGKIRNIYIGKFEERMPFLYVHFPTWFLEQNPDVHKNLKTNTERLVTLFDVYATMVHLLNPTKKLTPLEKVKVSPYGLSLMEEISPYRTCEKAGIFPHWCTCQVFQYVSPMDREILQSAKVVKDHLKNITIKYNQTCATINVDAVKEAKLGQLNDLVLRFLKHEGIILDRSVSYGERIVRYEDFLVTITTKPCGDIFEATVRHNVVDDSYDVVDVNNIDFDPSMHNCIEDQKLRPFCCCK